MKICGPLPKFPWAYQFCIIYYLQNIYTLKLGVPLCDYFRRILHVPQEENRHMENVFPKVSDFVRKTFLADRFRTPVP